MVKRPTASSVAVSITGRARRLVRTSRRPAASFSSTNCLAPTMQLHLLPDGDVRVCCRNPIPAGNIAEQRLTEIWAGVRITSMATELAAGNWPAGCEPCGAEVRSEGRDGSYPAEFDGWTERLGQGSAAGWPVRIEFNLSNACNLQCVQCSGDLSSSIRIHREGRAALPRVYGDQFLADLRLFLPHLRHANFAGGEPFLGPENYKVWDLIAEVAPDLPCTINTNATQWNARVVRVLDTLRPDIIVSLDAVTGPTFESIRVGSDFGVVMANFDRLLAHTRRHGKTLTVNHCLMRQNHHEFADLLLWAERVGVHVNVSVVRTPEDCSLASLPAHELRDVIVALEARSPEVRRRLRINRRTWERELARLRAWAREERMLPSPSSSSPSVLGLTARPGSATDLGALRAELATFGDGAVVHELHVGEGDRIVSCGAGLVELLGVDPTGKELQSIRDLLGDRFGGAGEVDVVATADRIDSSVRFAAADVRSVVVPSGAGPLAVTLMAIRSR